MASGQGLYPEIEPYDHGMLDAGDGHRVYWETCGNPAGRPAVVFHGGPGSGCTPTQRRYFDPSVYRIMLFDQRGCGRSTPHAGDDLAALDANTTWHLLGDAELLRHKLGIDRWLVLGGSWGATLAILYAETYPERVTGLVLPGVTTTSQREIDWLFGGGLGPLLPEQWERFRSFVPPEERGDLIAAYRRLLLDSDRDVCARAAEEWCLWESASLSSQPGPALARRFADPRYALGFARIVTNYFANGAWIEDGLLLQNAATLDSIPGIMINGALDLQAPLATARELKQAWPAADLVVVEQAGHAQSDPGMPRQIVVATDRLAVP